MKVVISSTYDDKYFWFIPLVAWLWNKLNIQTICFVPLRIPFTSNEKDIPKMYGLKEIAIRQNMILEFFICPNYKEATYAQVARLYAAAIDFLPEDEVLITSDCDMGVFGQKFQQLNDGQIHSFGGDLIDIHEAKQYPLCYIAMPVKEWRRIMDIDGKTYQQCLDETVGVIECDHFRGNQWSLDQNTIYNQFKKHDVIPIIHNRAKYPERFARNRLDRDDSFLLDRLSPDNVDYHFPRPGYEENNFNQILTVLKYHYPNEDFNWLVDYRTAYLKLL